MPHDYHQPSNLILLVSPAEDPDALNEALCDARHQLRGLSIAQLQEISSFVRFVRIRDGTPVLKKVLSRG